MWKISDSSFPIRAAFIIIPRVKNKNCVLKKIQTFVFIHQKNVELIILVQSQITFYETVSKVIVSACALYTKTKKQLEP